MGKLTTYEIKMRDGCTQSRTGTVINEIWGIDKRDGGYYLTHIPTGILITNADKQKTLKELVNQPNMIDEMDLTKICQAVYKFWNERRWLG